MFSDYFIDGCSIAKGELSPSLGCGNIYNVILILKDKPSLSGATFIRGQGLGPFDKVALEKIC